MNLKKALAVFLPGNRFESHVLAWIVFIIAIAGLYTLGQQKVHLIEFLADYILSLPIIFLISYTTAYLLVPWLLLRNKVIHFTLLFLLLLAISGVLEHYKTQYILFPLVSPERVNKDPLSFFSVFSAAFFILLPTVYFITIKYSRDWYRATVLKTEEESKHLRIELKYLKSQVHPHFLLVTLSNLELVARENPANAAIGIEKVSEILNFILYDCNVPEIRLSKEMEQIQRFIELQQLNYANKLEVNYSIIGSSVEISLAPLMVFTIVEFFFKNAGKNPDSTMKISVFLEIYHNILNCSVQGENFGLTEQDYNEDPGITNLKKRIEILYTDTASLSSRNFGNKFMIQLNLLNS